MKKSKFETRKQIKETLKQNSQSFGKWSDIICKKILNSNEYQQADIILSYMALPDEPDLITVTNYGFLTGKKVFIPKVDINSQTMEFYKFSPKQNQAGAYGIQEPTNSDSPLNNENLDKKNILILVPGRAFTTDGKRLGRGKGYYDKYLSLLIKKGDSTNCKITLIGICFNCQLLQDLPVEAFDIKMNRIISEE